MLDLPYHIYVRLVYGAKKGGRNGWRRAQACEVITLLTSLADLLLGFDTKAQRLKRHRILCSIYSDSVGPQCTASCQRQCPVLDDQDLMSNWTQMLLLMIRSRISLSS